MGLALTVAQTFEDMTCGECGITFYVPNSFYRERKEDGKGWHCPNGHPRVFTEREVDRLKRQLEQEKQLRATVERERDSAKRLYENSEKQTKRLKKRIQNGVCPCCKRSFNNLQRHMNHMHPGFDKTPAIA